MNATQLLNLLHTGEYAILTASEPAYPPALPGGNATLCFLLELLNYEPIEMRGVYRGVPDGVSYLVPDMEPDEALRLGERFGQAEIVLPEGMVDVRTLETAPWTGEVKVGPEAESEPYHSVLPNGLAFSLGFDLGNRRSLSTFLRRASWEGLDSLVGKRAILHVAR